MQYKYLTSMHYDSRHICDLVKHKFYIMKNGSVVSGLFCKQYLVNLCLAFSVAPTVAFGSTAVDIELALLVDVSRSVDAKEFIQQRDGYVNAFKDPSLFTEHIAKGPNKKIAATLVYWSSPDRRVVAVDWRLVDGVESARAFGEALVAATPGNIDLSGATRPFDGTTAPGSAISFVMPQFGSNAYEGSRKVIILSGDGAENAGPATHKVRDDALKNGVDTINALPIGSEALRKWFTENVQGGKDAFTVSAKDFPDLPTALQTMLKRTISGPAN